MTWIRIKNDILSCERDFQNELGVMLKKKSRNIHYTGYANSNSTYHCILLTLIYEDIGNALYLFT